MTKKILDGMSIGVGIVAIVGVAFAIAYANDLFTVDKDGTTKFAVSDAGKITVGATESYVNLVVQNDEVVAEADNKVDITADVLTVEGIRLENVAVSANIESSGAGGLDAGAEAGNTWYYVWVVTNNTGTLTNGLLSTSSTTPTLPSGFTKKRRIGAGRNDASGNFLRFVQEGSRVAYTDGIATNRILSGGQSLSFTAVSASSFIPATSQRVMLWNELSVNHGTLGQGIAAIVRKAGSGSIRGILNTVTITNTSTGGSDLFIHDMDTNASGQVEYRLDVAPTSGGLYLDVVGYYDRI